MKNGKPLIVAVLVVLCVTLGRTARAGGPASFDTGSLIIPMDTDYQDAGMLTAFGLVDKLLRAGVSVDWIIEPTKTCAVTGMTGKNTTYSCTPVDMTASATDLHTGAVIASHGYRGGPFVVDSSLAAAATAIVLAWQKANPSASTFTTVHVATAPFTAPVSRVLTAAPRIAVLDDTNQQIAFGYMNAALIPDEGNKAWGNTSVDLLADTAVAGTSGDTQDGALFGGVSGGEPQYCEIMTMHWDVGSSTIPGVVAEMTSFLKYPVHVNAECQAVNAVEGEPPDGGRADFVTTAGFQWPAPAQPTYVQFSNSSLPFAQIDGPFQTTGGSEPAYALAPGSSYYNQDIVMVRGAGVGVGVQDLWMTGYAKAACDISEEGCNGVGKVSYLGGHMYQSQTPISQNPQSQGARLFLNSLYEAGCVTGEGQPLIQLLKSAPSAVGSASLTFSILYSNAGHGAALGFVLTDSIPPGSSFVSATGGGTFSGGVVRWALGDLGKSGSGVVSFTVTLPAKGTYTNQATATFKVGLNTLTSQSNQTSTVWGDCGSDGDCLAPSICDTTTSQCVVCTQAEQQNCADAGSGVCQPNDTCGCVGAGDCPPGDACQAGACVPDVTDAAGDDSSSSGGGTDAGLADGTTGDGSSGGGGSDGALADATLDGGGSGDATVEAGGAEGSTSSSGSSSGAVADAGASSGSGSGGASSGGTSSGAGGDASDAGVGGSVGESSGCGCTVPGAGVNGAGGSALALVALFVARARRRRSGRPAHVGPAR